MSGDADTAETNGKRVGTNPGLQEAMDAFRLGRFDEAQMLARGVVVTAPGCEEAWRILVAVAHRQGNMAGAAKTLQDAITKNSKSAPLFTLLGTLLRAAGRSEDAKIALRHALVLQPTYEDAALNLGNLLAQQGRMAEAEEIFLTGAKHAPTQPRFPLQLGRLMLALGLLDRAKLFFKMATAVSRQNLTCHADRQQDVLLYIEAAMHLSSVLLGQANRLEALNYLYDVVQLGGDEVARRQFADCVSAIPFAEAQPLLKPLLTRALSEAWANPDSLMRVSARLLLLDPEFAEAMQSVGQSSYKTGPVSGTSALVKIVGDPLLRSMLTAGVITDPELERLLTTIRGALLRGQIGPSKAAIDEFEELCEFTVALATQCFITEYAYLESEDETYLVKSLIGRVVTAAASGEFLEALDLAILAAYRSLHTLDCADKLLMRSWPPFLEPVLLCQQLEPMREAELRRSILQVTPIRDPISAAVRDQYEANPFPRWVKAAMHTQRYTLDAWVRGVSPNLVPPARNPEERISVLVVGCGTGQETVASATRFANSEVLAVDLSLTSLAFALRKARELALGNITYAQGDLLELEKLGRQFDIVECAGVLHHLSDPMAGWHVLSRLTKPGGYMLIALYSALGRRDLIPVADFIVERNYGTSAKELRRFRADVLTLPPHHPARAIVAKRDDFYNLSMLRDLMFHVREHAFTISEIVDALKSLRLQFGGFLTDPETCARFRQRFGQNVNLASLDDWQIFEFERPDTFSAMYHFLVAKPVIT